MVWDQVCGPGWAQQVGMLILAKLCLRAALEKKMQLLYQNVSRVSLGYPRFVQPSAWQSVTSVHAFSLSNTPLYIATCESVLASLPLDRLARRCLIHSLFALRHELLVFAWVLLCVCPCLRAPPYSMAAWQVCCLPPLDGCFVVWWLLASTLLGRGCRRTAP